MGPIVGKTSKCQEMQHMFREFQVSVRGKLFIRGNCLLLTSSMFGTLLLACL